MKTSCVVTFGKNSFAIGDDAAITLLNGGLQSFGDLSLVADGLSNSIPFATYEPNFWLLDGNYKFAPASNGRAGWISTDMSGSSGGFDFGSPKPSIQIDFDDVHSTDGITITFSEYSGDYADSVRVVFYNAALSIIDDDTYTPTSTSFFTNNPIANFKRIVIEINSTHRAQRYARVTRIDFDEVIRFSGTEIKAAKVIEEVNLLSTELPVNTVDLELFSSDGDFSITNPAGFYANLQYKEPLDVLEDINGSMVFIGRFYLDKWESETENIARFEASDLIGLLGESDFEGMSGIETISYYINKIMTGAGFDYELDATYTAAPQWLVGFIGKVSYRDALQQVAINIGAYVTCSRSKVIRIVPMELASNLSTYDYTLTDAQKGINSKTTLKPLVTGVEITGHYYGTDEIMVQLAKLALPAGNHRIYFGLDVPVWDSFTLTNATNISSGVWAGTYIDINVAVDATVTIEGAKYTDAQKVYSEYNGALPANTKPNIVRVSDATMITSFVQPSDYIHASDVVERFYDYYQQRYVQKIKLFGSLIAPGNSVLIDVQSNKQMKGIVERMESDLARGYVSNVEITGVVI